MYLAFGLARLNNYYSIEVFASERVERELMNDIILLWEEGGFIIGFFIKEGKWEIGWVLDGRILFGLQKGQNNFIDYSFTLTLMNKNFNIQETVHRNIEKNQFPSFSNHRSLVGWCSMNYPKVLQNPIYAQKDTST